MKKVNCEIIFLPANGGSVKAYGEGVDADEALRIFEAIVLLNPARAELRINGWIVRSWMPLEKALA